MRGLIGVDWGTSNLRAWRFGAGGAVMERRACASGIAAVPDGGFAAVLREAIGDWADGRTPILLGGMVGSRNGWVEVPYLDCPADPAALARAAHPLATEMGPAWIVPGLSCLTPAGLYDVMRGEEVQIAGTGVGEGLVVLPGTHSKWAVLRGGRVQGFRTFMTGELFALLKEHSLLGRLMEPGAADRTRFLLGVRRALDDPALSALLFSVRTEALAGALPPTGLADYLSGLLIGAELRAGLAGADGPVTLVGAPTLMKRYALALAEAGAPAPVLVDGEAAAIGGLLGIARHMRGLD